ncbi:MAG: hypothetical protein LBT00_14235 [Spirochaetaceae bacterium]|nr:hypothetical protein [Spirochaetaceae bacterium]
MTTLIFHLLKLLEGGSLPLRSGPPGLRYPPQRGTPPQRPRTETRNRTRRAVGARPLSLRASGTLPSEPRHCERSEAI